MTESKEPSNATKPVDRPKPNPEAKKPPVVMVLENLHRKK